MGSPPGAAPGLNPALGGRRRGSGRGNGERSAGGQAGGRAALVPPQLRFAWGARSVVKSSSLRCRVQNSAWLLVREKFPSERKAAVTSPLAVTEPLPPC